MMVNKAITMTLDLTNLRNWDKEWSETGFGNNAHVHFQVLQIFPLSTDLSNLLTKGSNLPLQFRLSTATMTVVHWRYYRHQS